MTDARLSEMGIRLAAELRDALDDPKRYEWGDGPWEHLGDAEKDVRLLLATVDELVDERDALSEAQQFPVETVARLEQEREGYKRDFLAARERSEIQETRLRMLQEAVSEYLAYPTLAGRRERLELILADLNPDGGSKGFSGGA